MEGCRRRDTPIMTFINKLDREGRDPIDLLDEVASALGIQFAPVTWPIGMGKRLKGVVHLVTGDVHLYAQGRTLTRYDSHTIHSLYDHQLVAPSDSDDILQSHHEQPNRTNSSHSLYLTPSLSTSQP